MEKVLLFVHILFAAIWLGGAAISAILLFSAKKVEPLQAKTTIQSVTNLAKFVFAPLSVLVFLTGIGLIIVAGWSFAEFWISWAFSGVIASIILGVVFHARAGRKAMVAATSQDTVALSGALKTWLLIAYLDLAIITSVLGLMVFKPGT